MNTVRNSERDAMRKIHQVCVCICVSTILSSFVPAKNTLNIVFLLLWDEFTYVFGKEPSIISCTVCNCK